MSMECDSCGIQNYTNKKVFVWIGDYEKYATIRICTRCNNLYAKNNTEIPIICPKIDGQTKKSEATI
jgi:hypothetical protein